MTDKSPANDKTLALVDNEDGGDDKSNFLLNQGPNVQYLLNSPAYMSAAVRRQLLQEMVKGLPVNVQKRINALRNIELERLNLEAKFFEEVNYHCFNTFIAYRLLR